MKVKREIEKTDTKGNPVKRTALTLAGHFFVGMGIIGSASSGNANDNISNSCCRLLRKKFTPLSYSIDK